ncbi:MAG: lipoyl domain-containing protein [Bacillus sp. (in: firmicutes)]
MYEVKLPQLSDSADESSVVLWYKAEGDQVDVGDTLLEVQTEKATSEITADVAGVLQKIAVKRGETAHVGDVLATKLRERNRALCHQIRGL